MQQFFFLNWQIFHSDIKCKKNHYNSSKYKKVDTPQYGITEIILCFFIKLDDINFLNFNSTKKKNALVKNYVR